MTTLPIYLVEYFDRLQPMIQEDKLEQFAKDIIQANKVCNSLGGRLTSRQILATIALPYLNND